MPYVWTRWFAPLAVAVSLFAGRPASAQTTSELPVPEEGNGDGLDSHLFRSAVDTKGFFATNGTDVLGANGIAFGLVIDYGRNVLRTNEERPDRGTEALVRDSFQGAFSFNFGIADRAEIGLTVPVDLLSSSAARDLGPTGATYDAEPLDVSNIAYLALHAKLKILPPQRGFGLAALLQGAYSFGDAPRQLSADPGFWYWARLVAEGRLTPEDRLRIGGELGYRGNTGSATTFGLDSAGLPQLAEGVFEYGNQLTFGVAVSYRVLETLDLVVDSYAALIPSGDSDAKQRFAQEILGGVKVFVDEKSYLTLAAGGRAWSTGYSAADARAVIGFVFEPTIADRDGDGIKDSADACPDVPEDRDGFEDADGCPDLDNDRDGVPDERDACPDEPEDRDGVADTDGCPEGGAADRDHDGILDANDACPDAPEDRDGVEDADGCPEADDDHDGVPDGEDACPDEAEDIDGFEDSDGCPDPDNDGDGLPDSRDECPDEKEVFNDVDDEDGCADRGKVIVEGDDIRILEEVQFETNSATIKPESDGILDAVTAALKGNPDLTAIEVAGHADSRGSEFHNLQLTKKRAQAVAQALIDRGVESERLVYQGYGEYCPIVEGETEEAYGRNRRVDFKIVATAKGPTGAPRGCPRAVERGVKPPELPATK